MIYLYSGTPGSGKSLHTAERLYHWLRAGKPAICNFPIDLKKVSKHPEKLKFWYKQNFEITPEFLINFSMENFGGRQPKEDSIMLVLDEAQLLFNAREWQKTGRSEWLSFFSQHRKFGYWIVLVAQFDRMIDRQIRSLIEYEFIHRKVSNLGWKGKMLSVFALGNLFVSVKMWYPLSEKVSADWFCARKKYYGIYDTFGRFSEKASGSGD